MAREVWLFTMRFPFGNGESFLENELPMLCARYERVVLIPLLAEGAPRPLPANAEIWHPVTDPFRGADLPTLLRHWRPWRTLTGLVRSSAPDQRILHQHWPVLRSKCRQALARSVRFQRAAADRYDPGRVLLYSYWTADWATVLGLWQLLDPRVRFVCRMHGFDLYAERYPDGWPPFRSFHLARTARFFVASQAGLDHLMQRHPAQRSLFELARLGTLDHGLGPWSPGNVLRVVSCANLVPLKRVHLIAEALQRVQVPVHWTHFGDGPERERIAALLAARPAHVSVDLKGRVPNAELLAWYRTNPVDIFVHTSSSEGGVPVALQEAASFGIPLLAADAGGVREIVNSTTGLLLPGDATPRSIADALNAHGSSERASMAFREGVRACWSHQFRAEDVYARSCARLEEVLG